MDTADMTCRSILSRQQAFNPQSLMETHEHFSLTSLFVPLWNSTFCPFKQTVAWICWDVSSTHFYCPGLCDSCTPCNSWAVLVTLYRYTWWSKSGSIELCNSRMPSNVIYCRCILFNKTSPLVMSNETNPLLCVRMRRAWNNRHKWLNYLAVVQEQDLHALSWLEFVSYNRQLIKWMKPSSSPWSTLVSAICCIWLHKAPISWEMLWWMSRKCMLL